MMAARQNKLERVREFKFTPRDFDRVRRLIYQRAGISLADSKCEMVYSRLARRLRAMRLESFEAYLDALESGDGEWEAFTNALTTNLTSFFREEHHFPILAEHVKKMGGPKAQIDIWCCASSTGEEAYSIAMALCEALGTMMPPARIIATDIDTNVLNVASSGIYPLERVEKLSPERIRRFFLRGRGSQEGMI